MSCDMQVPGKTAAATPLRPDLLILCMASVYSKTTFRYAGMWRGLKTLDFGARILARA